MGREAEGRVSVEQVGDAEAKDVMGLAAAGLGWLAGWRWLFVVETSHYNNLRMYAACPNHDYHDSKLTSIASKVTVRTISNTIC